MIKIKKKLLVFLPYISIGLLQYSLVQLFDLQFPKNIWLGLSITSLFIIAAFLKYD